MLQGTVPLVILSALCLTCFAKTLPDYVTKCSERDPQLNDCIKERANAMIPRITPGDRKQRLLKLNPFDFDKVVTEIGTMHLELTKGKVYGLDKVKVESFDVDKKEGTLKFTASTPKFAVKSDYEANGTIFVLPIEGKGHYEASFFNANFTFTLKLENFNRNSKEPLKIVESDLDYTYGDATINLGNLFNGNKELSDPVNKLVNEEHKTIYKQFKSVFVEVLNELVLVIIKPVLSGYRYSDLFAE